MGDTLSSTSHGLWLICWLPDWPWSVCHRHRPPAPQELSDPPLTHLFPKLSPDKLQGKQGASGTYQPRQTREDQSPDLPRAPSYSPTHENSMALAQAVTNGLSMLPGWWSVRSHPVPRLWGGGTGAVCPATAHTTATLLPLPRQSPTLGPGRGLAKEMSPLPYPAAIRGQDAGWGPKKIQDS